MSLQLILDNGTTIHVSIPDHSPDDDFGELIQLLEQGQTIHIGGNVSKDIRAFYRDRELWRIFTHRVVGIAREKN